MNWRKFLFIAIITIIIAITAYIIIRIDGCQPPKKQIISIFIFENYDNLEKHINQTVLKYVEDNKIPDKKDININVYSINEISGKEYKIIHSFSMKQTEDKLKKIKDILNVALKTIRKQKLSIQETNSLLNKMMFVLDDLSKKPEDDNHVFIFGRFPSCYKQENFRNTNIYSQLKGKRYSYMTIVWGLNTDINRPEKKELQSVLNKKAFVVFDRTDSSPLPTCPEEELKNVYAILFKKLTSEQIKEFSNFIFNTFGNKLNVTLWNDGPINNQNFKVFENKGGAELIKGIEKAQSGHWTSVGFLIKQANNTLSQVKPEIEKNLIIVGNMPAMGRGNQLDVETWKNLKSLKTLNSYYYFPKGVKKSIEDEALIEGLESIKFILKEVK